MVTIPINSSSSAPPEPRKPILRGRINLAQEAIPLEALFVLPEETASEYRAVVFRDMIDKKTKTRTLALATEDPASPTIEHLAQYLQDNNHVAVELYETTREDIDSQLARYIGTNKNEAEGNTPEAGGTQEIVAQQLVTTEEELEKVIHSALIPNIVSGIISFALAKKASDIHIEPLEENVRIRYRIDGNLVNITTIPRYFRNALISRVKILSQLKIDESRVPQDGRFEFDFRSDNNNEGSVSRSVMHTIDIRVSTFPTVHGEKVVLRLLDKDAGIMTLEQLGITGKTFDTLVKAINRPFGIVLATGPTGSGKTTTLYAILNRIAHPDINVVTLEDPVEYEIPGINQSQVKPIIGYNFAEGLRAVLRQDPNVIMVGEIRDLETASMATHAALTGHLVLSTLHTNDAAGALPRLLNMGVEPYLLTSALDAVIAQRLVRKLCVACRQQVQLPEVLLDQIRQELSHLKDYPVTEEKNYVFYQAVGCGQCTDGYSGRIGIYEVLTMSDTIESLTISKQPAAAIGAAAQQEGMITLRQDGILKALKGITSIDEVWRVTSQD